MSEPRCPLCGAKSSWLRLEGMPFELTNTIPTDCHFCKEEERIHWKQWEEGIDITMYGGTPMNADVEAKPRRTRNQGRRETPIWRMGD